MRKTILWLLLCGGVLGLLLLAGPTRLMTQLFGEAAYRDVHLPAGNMGVPEDRNISWNRHSAAADSIYAWWARQPLREAQFRGKGNAPRILLAKLLTSQDIPAVNAAIRKMTAWGVSGSSWALNRRGDYDFTITALTTLLWQFGDKPELLYPDARDHLLKTLLTEDGNRWRSTAPRTLGLVRETENHILMTEGSRYLKNRWIREHGNKGPYYDNNANGMEGRMLQLLASLREGGLYEFNSRPYVGYTIGALLNLEAFASDTVRRAARHVLDYMNWCYALGSYGLKYYPPMRRRYDKEGLRGITDDYHSMYMKAWLSYAPADAVYGPVDTPATSAERIIPRGGYDHGIHGGEVHFLMGACMPYRPADEVVRTIFDKGSGYFVRLGHGPGACPEIYAAGRHFLLSAGGVNRGRRSLIVARPITLFLDDSATQLQDVIHLAGPGKDFMKWNNTGVYRNFACAAGPVVVPPLFRAVAEKGDWRVYVLKDSVMVVAYSTDVLGLVAVFEGVRGGAGALLEDVLRSNPDRQVLQQHFQWPGGERLSYDVHAPADKWVITSGGERNFDGWPLIEAE